MDVLADAERTGEGIGPISDLLRGGLSLEMAHKVCERNIERHVSGGDRVAGFKIGFATVPQPDMEPHREFGYGYLLASKVLPDNTTIDIDQFIAPKIETEICFVLSRDLAGSHISSTDVLQATRAISASFEIVDARIRDWQCPYVDFVADNCFASRIVVGPATRQVQEVDLMGETATLLQDGIPVVSSKRATALGHPADSIAWLAGALAERGRHLSAGMVIVTGSLTPATRIAGGSAYAGNFSTLGAVRISFK